MRWERTRPTNPDVRLLDHPLIPLIVFNVMLVLGAVLLSIMFTQPADAAVGFYDATGELIEIGPGYDCPEDYGDATFVLVGEEDDLPLDATDVRSAPVILCGTSDLPGYFEQEVKPVIAPPETDTEDPGIATTLFDVARAAGFVQVIIGCLILAGLIAFGDDFKRWRK